MRKIISSVKGVWRLPVRAHLGWLLYKDRISTHTCQRVSCEGLQRPLTVLEEHHMYGKHVCPRWKISNMGRMLSLHCAWYREEKHARKHHKGRAPVSWNWSLFYAFDLEVRLTRVRALILNCKLLNLDCVFKRAPVSLFTQGRRSRLHSWQTCEEKCNC